MVGMVLPILPGATFDCVTVDHVVLLSRPLGYLRIQGKSPAWSVSYLCNRNHVVHSDGVSANYLEYFVLYDTELMTQLVFMYALVSVSIIRKHGLNFHILADTLFCMLSVLCR